MTYLLANPWALVAVCVVPLIWWAWFSKRRRAAVRFASLSLFDAGRTDWSARARLILPVLRTLAILLLVLAIAHPQQADEQTRVRTEGIAIQMVVDRSGSMSEQDFADGQGRVETRLDAVKDVVKAFVEGDGDTLEGREGDLVGLLAFARYADTECPLTRDHQHLVRALGDIRVPTQQEAQLWQEDGTAIGDALLLATERIRNIGRRLGEKDDFQIKSRVVILLTDGEQNAGEHEPIEAAEAAAALGVKVYTIGAAPDYRIQNMGFFGRRKIPNQVDEETLKEVAKITGGKFFRAKDAESLKAIYAEIDKLERSVVDEKRFYHYEELACVWWDWLGMKWPPILMVVLGLLALEIILANTRLRKIP